jgi:hypothetical protein
METHQHPLPHPLPAHWPPQASALPAQPQLAPAAVVACSICLRVLRGSAWVEAEEAIRELRSFERRDPVRLGPGLCNDCCDRVAERRGHALAAVA